MNVLSKPIFHIDEETTLETEVAYLIDTVTEATKNVTKVRVRLDLLKNLKGCNMCLYWTETHKRDTCPARNRKAGQPYRNCQ